MSTGLLLLVLCGALLHAAWNSVLKSGGRPLLDMVGMTLAAALWAGLALPFLPLPAAPSWPYLAISVAIHVIYFLLVAASLHRGELSVIYPLTRGVAPLFTTLIATVWLGETRDVASWLAVGLLCGGVLLIGWEGARDAHPGRRGLLYALLNGAVIVMYTIVDGVGVRLAGEPMAYVGWMFVGNGLGVALVAALRFGPVGLRDSLWRRRWHGVGLGAATLVSYGIALHAMAHAPIGLVAAVRETAVLFAALFAWVWLKERLGPVRWLATVFIVWGLVRLAV